MKKLAILYLVFFSMICYSQNGYFQYSVDSLNSNFYFPSFINLSDPISVEKINHHLEIGELCALKDSSNIFENAISDDTFIYGGQRDISFEIHTNTNKILSLSFSNYSFGATSFCWNQTYTFNSGNGDLIQLSDIFTTEGLELFLKYSSTKRIAQLKREMKKNKVKFSNSQGLKEYINYLPRDNEPVFYIQDSMIIIDGFNDLMKNDKFLNLDVVTEFNLSEFSDFLNSYGKCVFSLNSDSIQNYHSTSLPQLFAGTFGNDSILSVFDGFKDQIESIEFYLNNGNKQKLLFEGVVFDGNIDLKGNYDGEDTGDKIELKFNGVLAAIQRVVIFSNFKLNARI